MSWFDSDESSGDESEGFTMLSPIGPPYDCIVLDLDDTLICTSSKEKGGQKISFNGMDGDPMEMWVHKRPGFDDFLRRCFQHCDVGVWSMGQPGYVNAVVNLFPHRPAFVYNWCNCDRANGKIFKRLNNIPRKGRVIMIDDRLDCIETCNRISTVIISKWDPHKTNDKVLYELSEELFE